MSSVEEPLERFAGEVAKILELDPGAVSGESRLVADLDFDSLAFVELGVLLMDRYGSRNFMAAIAGDGDTRSMTVRSVFENYVGGAVEPVP